MHRFKEEFVKFCENVSVQGVSKIVKSERISLRIMWLCAGVVCSGFLVWQLVNLFQSYSSYPYATSYGELPAPNVFPSVTLCSLQEKSSQINYSEYLRKNEYIRKITNITNLSNSIDLEEFGRIVLEFFDDYLYWFALPKFDNNPNNSIPLLVEYSTENYQNYDMDDYNCTLYNETLYHPFYYNCYLFELSKHCRAVVKSLTMVIYTNSLYESRDQESVQSKDSGILAMLSSLGEFANEHQGVILGVGSSSIVEMSMVVKKTLDTPYTVEGCEKNTLLDDGAGTPYTLNSCFGYCMQKTSFEKCGCVIADMFVFPGLQNASICGETILASRKHELDKETEISMVLKMFEEMGCLVKFLKQIHNTCIKTCKNPCIETYYDRVVQTLHDWPRVSVHKYFFETYVKNYLIAGSEHFNYFENYIETIDKYDNGNISIQELNAFFKTVNKIGSNFLKVKFTFKNSKPFSITDSPVYTWETMLGTAGGTLSLWLGMTFMTFFEVIEFFLNVLRAMKECQCSKKLSHKTNTPT